MFELRFDSFKNENDVFILIKFWFDLIWLLWASEINDVLIPIWVWFAFSLMVKCQLKPIDYKIFKWICLL